MRVSKRCGGGGGEVREEKTQGFPVTLFDQTDNAHTLRNTHTHTITIIPFNGSWESIESQFVDLYY